MDESAQILLNFLFQTSTLVVWIIFLTENAFIVFLVLLAGRGIQKLFFPQAIAYSYSSRDWLICSVTVLINTAVTYIGFWLWKKEIIKFQIHFSFDYILRDFVLLFLAMDFLMYIFHFLIHKTSLHKAIHSLHHEAVNPQPIDLFVLHPAETLSFGTLWLSVLLIFSFNIYSVVIYLTTNVLFGLLGHLGLEPLPSKLNNHPLFKYLGTSTFHHTHHQEVNCNFGFYTTIWDRLFGTLKK